MESAAEALVRVDDLDETSNYKLEVRLDDLIVAAPFKWQARQVEHAACSEVQDLVKDMRLLVEDHLVQADTHRTTTKRRFKVSIAFTVKKINAKQAKALTDCLETFVEGVVRRISGMFEYSFTLIESPPEYPPVQRDEQEVLFEGVGTLLLVAKLLREDKVAQA